MWEDSDEDTYNFLPMKEHPKDQKGNRLSWDIGQGYKYISETLPIK